MLCFIWNCRHALYPFEIDRIWAIEMLLIKYFVPTKTVRCIVSWPFVLIENIWSDLQLFKWFFLYLCKPFRQNCWTFRLPKIDANISSTIEKIIITFNQDLLFSPSHGLGLRIWTTFENKNIHFSVLSFKSELLQINNFV